MGRAQIISEAGEGLYTIEVKHDTTAADTQLSKLNKILSHVNEIIAEEEGKDDPDQSVIAALDIRKTALEKRIEAVTEARDADYQTEAWCADLTTGLTGYVGTIEPGTERRNGINIQPGYSGESAWDGARDGQATPFLTMDVADAMRNFALLPAIQKWRPTYRYGTLSNLDQAANTCTVTLDNLTSSIQELDINHQSVLGDVPIEYMSCNASAFADGDRVIVRFDPYDAEGQPRVIGFIDHPKSCGDIILIKHRTEFIFWDPHNNSIYNIPGFSQPMTSSQRSQAMIQLGLTTLIHLSSSEMAGGGASPYTYHGGEMSLINNPDDYCSVTITTTPIDDDYERAEGTWACSDSTSNSQQYTIAEDTGASFNASFSYNRTESRHSIYEARIDGGGVPLQVLDEFQSHMTMALVKSIHAIDGASIKSSGEDRRGSFLWVSGSYEANYHLIMEDDNITSNAESTTCTVTCNFKSALGNDESSVLVDSFSVDEVSPTLDERLFASAIYSNDVPCIEAAIKDQLAIVLEQATAYQSETDQYWGTSKLYASFDGQLNDPEDPDSGYSHSWDDLVLMDMAAIYQAFGTTFNDDLLYYGLGAGIDAYLLS